ncbi:MAG: CHAT domain-containing protein, partial [Geminicoccaceae bacterium]|nr:CHAT domain-containing protein [Geminicoccaceae bacterium]
ALAEIATSDGSFDSFALHALYVGLVGPFADALGGISHLIVLGDGAARRLPLIALTTKPAEPVASGTDLGSLAFLIEQVAISTIQDLTALTLRRSPSAASIVFAGFAAPGSAEVPAPDPARVARLQAIAASLTADRALLDLQAAKKGIMALDLGLYRTLAFAMPVALDGDGLPALAVTPGAVDDGRQLGVRDLARLDLDADLVLVLDDGQNPPAGTWAPSALLPAFAVAGARALLTTYWAVGADPVSRIMGPAVQAMLNDPERPPAVALQDAIRPLIGGEAGPAASQPAFWAPFGVSLATR